MQNSFVSETMLSTVSIPFHSLLRQKGWRWPTREPDQFWSPSFPNCMKTTTANHGWRSNLAPPSFNHVSPFSSLLCIIVGYFWGVYISKLMRFVKLIFMKIIENHTHIPSDFVGATFTEIFILWHSRNIHPSKITHYTVYYSWVSHYLALYEQCGWSHYLLRVVLHCSIFTPRTCTAGVK